MTIRISRSPLATALLVTFLVGCAGSQAKDSEPKGEAATPAPSRDENTSASGGDGNFSFNTEDSEQSDGDTFDGDDVTGELAKPGGAKISARRNSAPTTVSPADKSKDRTSHLARRPEREKAGKKTVTESDARNKQDAKKIALNVAKPITKAPPEPKPDQAKTPAEESSNEEYKNWGVNPMTSTKKDRFSTFSIDVDTGSYTITRRKLNEGRLPSAKSVRVEEYINYFNYRYPTPDSGPFAVHFEAAPSPFSADANTKLMRIGVQGMKVPASKRKPVHLTFLIDVSGSMNSPDKLGLVKASLTLLTKNLREGDTVAIATYAGRVAKILEPTGLRNRGKILSALNSLSSGGSTAMNDGLGLAYKLALQNHKRGHVNRVIVCSDGDANVGPSSHQAILKQIRKYVADGVTLSTIGFGMGNYKDVLMEQLANKGNGNYYYIDSIKEARKVFGSQLDGTLEVIAKDVKIQVEFDPKAVTKYRLIGYENRDIADKDFRNDRVDAGEIGSGHQVTALYEVVVNPESSSRQLATVRLRHKHPQGAKAKESTFAFSQQDLHKKLAEASKDFQFAASVATFAEILRGSPYAKNLSLALVEEVAKGSLRGMDDRREFLALVRKARRLKK